MTGGHFAHNDSFRMYFGEQGIMVGGRSRVRRRRHDGARRDPLDVSLGREDVIEPHVRAPRRECVPVHTWVKTPPDVGVMLVEHHLNRVAGNVPPTHPYHRANPGGHLCDVEPLARRERVEVAGDDVESTLMLANAVEQEPDLAGAAAFAPLREPRTEVQPED